MSEPEIDALLRHSSWVQAVAASLSRDPGLAEDAVQDTWLAVLRRGPRDPRSLRAWLATLVRRQLRQSRRGAERRVRREERHARALALPSAAELVERAESDREIARAVLELREPFRTAVLLRWFDELAPDEIAERTGVPVSTVYSRLARGHAALRERLERDARPRRGRASALLALLSREPARALRRSLRFVAGALQTAAVVATLALAGWAFARASGRPERALPSVAVAREDAPLPHDAQLLVAPPAQREPLDIAAASAAVRPRRSARVLDPAGAPVPDVELVVAENESADAPALQSAVSAADGSFAFAAPASPALLLARDAAWETVLACLVDPERTGECVVVVAPKVAVAGRVLAPDRAPLADAIVELFIQPGLPVAFERALDAGRPKRPWLRTGADGTFAFEGLPALREAQLSVRHPAFGSALVPVPDDDRATLEVVLEPLPVEFPVVRGIVRDARGRFVEGAEVAAFPSATRSDASGRFELVLRPPYPRPRIAAVKPGVGGAALELEPRGDARWSAEPLEPLVIDLVLPERCGELQGRIVDERGRPLAGAQVWLADPTFVRATPRGALAAESLVGDPDPPVWRPVETDASGAFRLAGLLAREYRVCALDPRTLESTSLAVHAGERVELVLPGRSERLAGRLVDSRGRALSGVTVQLVREVFRQPPGHGMEPVPVSGPSCRTDADGRFALDACATEGTLLRLTSDAILPTTLDVGALTARADLVLVVSLRAHLRIELDDAENGADSFEAVGEDGQPRELVQLRDGCSHPHRRPALTRGRSLVLTVPDDVRELVLYRRGQELDRFPVAIEPGRINVIRR